MSPAPLATISASYGAGGSRVAPLLAERLDVPFAERVMRRQSGSTMRRWAGDRAAQQAWHPNNPWLWLYIDVKGRCGGKSTPPRRASRARS
jgi:hypothetical protein